MEILDRLLMATLAAIPASLVAETTDPATTPAGTAQAATDPAVSFQAAFSRDDYDAKRKAIADINRPGIDDDVALPLLVEAVGDRQAHDDAVAALRQRTGLKPPAFEGQSHYPAYPPSDDPASWQYWLTDRQRDQSQEAAVDTALAHAREALAAAQEAERATASSQHPGDAPQAAASDGTKPGD